MYIQLFFNIERKNIKYGISPLNISYKIPDIFLILLKTQQLSWHFPEFLVKSFKFLTIPDIPDKVTTLLQENDRYMTHLLKKRQHLLGKLKASSVLTRSPWLFEGFSLSKIIIKKHFITRFKNRCVKLSISKCHLIVSGKQKNLSR